MKRVLSLAFAAGLVLSAGAANAKVLNLNVDTCTGGCGLAQGSSYGKVTVTGEGANSLTFAVELADGVYFNQAGHPEVLFSLAGAPAINVTSLTPSASFAAVGAQSAGSYSAGGALGAFDYKLSYAGSPSNNGNLPAGGLQQLLFTVTGSSPLQLASGVLPGRGARESGVYFVTDVYGANGKTGRIGATLSAAVPEPATWAMMILGVFGAGAMVRSSRRAAAAA